MRFCYVFTYGTLLDPQIRKDVLGYPISSLASEVSGFRMAQVKLSGISYPMLVEDKQNKDWISGAYFKIDETDLKKLDEYESTAYRRKLVTAADGTKVWIYYR